MFHQLPPFAGAAIVVAGGIATATELSTDKSVTFCGIHSLSKSSGTRHLTASLNASNLQNSGCPSRCFPTSAQIGKANVRFWYRIRTKCCDWGCAIVGENTLDIKFAEKPVKSDANGEKIDGTFDVVVVVIIVEFGDCRG